MDLKRIRDLLEKYYNGETSLEEENTLHSYFAEGSVDDEFIADKDIFLYNIQERKLEKELPDISNEIWSKIQNTNVVYSQKERKLNYFYLRIAAGILILLGTFFFLRNQVFDKKYDMQISDTYQTPEEAYQQAKETLMYVSAMMNKGTGHMKPIYKVNKEVENLNKLSLFNDGIEEMQTFNTYVTANKYFKQ